MKKILYLLLLLPYFMMAQAEFEKIATTEAVENNSATRIMVQDATTGENQWVLKSSMVTPTNISLGAKTANTIDLVSSTGTGAVLPSVTTTEAGLMNATDKVKLNGVATGATANSTDAQLRDRTTHTGVQAISTVTGLQTALDGKQSTIANNVTYTGTITSNYISKISGAGTISNSLLFDNGTNIGLGTLTPQSQFQVTGSANTSYGQITSGVGIQSNSSGSGLITAINNTPADPTNGMSSGANFGFNSSYVNFFGMGLGSIRNSKYDIWFQTGVNNGGGFRWYRGILELMSISSNGNLLINTVSDNAVDKLQVNGTISHAAATTANQGVIKSQLDLKSDLASPTFTGTPTAPTATVGTNTTQLATTAFVLANGSANAVLLTGNQTKTGFLTMNNPIGGGTKLIGDNLEVSATSSLIELTTSANSNKAIIIKHNGNGIGQSIDIGSSGGSGISINSVGGARTAVAFTDSSATKGSITTSGVANMSQYRIQVLNTAPTSATDTGTLGEIRITATYIYVCTATNTWVRSALATW